jgi:hexosaminidase
MDQIPFLFGFNSNQAPSAQGSSDLKLRTQYTGPVPSEKSETATGEGITNDDIVVYAINSTWATLFQTNFYPWKFHPRDWDEPSPSQSNTSYISRVDVKVLKTADLAREFRQKTTPRTRC